MINRKIIVADDHPLFLNGLCRFLNEREYNIASKARNGKEAINAIETHQPVLGILDIEMPHMSGLEVAKIAKEKKLDARIVILSFHKEAELINHARQLNVMGYLPKDNTSTGLDSCLKAVLNGNTYFSEDVTDYNSSHKNWPTDQLNTLTPSETKILKLVAEGLTSDEIASLLHISKRTVDKHRSNIITKLSDVKDIQNLSVWAFENQTIISHL